MSHTLGTPPGLNLEALPEPPWLHRIDPRARILAAVAFAFVLVSLSDMLMLLVGVAIGAILVVMAHLPVKDTFKRTVGVDLFIVFLLILLPFTTPGETWFTVGPLAATWEGLWRACEISLKAMGVILALLALVGTLEAPQLGHALHRLGVSEKLVHILMFTVRYLDVLRAEYQRLRLAMKARAFEPRSGLHTWRTYGYLVGMLLVRSLERAERIHQAMKCRGFTGRFHLLTVLRAGSRDILFGGVMLLAVSLLLAGEWYP